jgi:hypothetical protein
MLWDFVVFLRNSQLWGLIELFIKYSQLGLLGEYWKLGTKMKSQDENSREVNKRGMRNQTSFVTQINQSEGILSPSLLGLHYLGIDPHIHS